MLKVGIIGCGNIAKQKHMPNLHRHEAVELTAFFDVTRKNALEAREKYGSKNSVVYKSIDDLLSSGIDVVHVCTPNHTHAEISIKALDKDIHVMCEKPMAMSSKEADSIYQAFKQSNAKFTVGFQNRFRKDVIILKKMIDKGDLGDIYHARAHATRRRAVPVWGRFLDKDYQGGGPLIDIGVHAIDMTLWLMDKFDPIYVTCSTYNELGQQEGLFNSLGSWDNKDFTVEDSAFGTIVMKDGSSVFVEASWALNALEVGEARTTLCGTKAGADMKDGLRINTDVNRTLQTIYPEYQKNQLEYYDDSLDDENYVEITAWIDSIINDEDPIVKIDQVMVVTRIIEAMYQSAEEQKAVYL